MMESEEQSLEQPTSRQPRSRKQNSRSFLVLVGAVLGMILLSVFLTLRLNTFTSVLILLTIGGLIMLVVIWLDKRDDTKPENLHEMDGTFYLDDNEQDSAESTTPHLLVQGDERQEGLTPFELLVQEALDSIPGEFHQQMENLVVIVEPEPDAHTLAQLETGNGQTLLGLYHGVPLTSISHPYALLPEQITIYQNTIERYCHGDPERIREQVRATVLHEVAHHFGIGHEDMPIWVK